VPRASFEVTVVLYAALILGPIAWWGASNYLGNRRARRVDREYRRVMEEEASRFDVERQLDELKRKATKDTG